MGSKDLNGNSGRKCNLNGKSNFSLLVQKYGLKREEARKFFVYIRRICSKRGLLEPRNVKNLPPKALKKHYAAWTKENAQLATANA